ncbi:hypothetical protein ACXN5S_18960 [Pseudoroseicyclus sp. H15]
MSRTAQMAALAELAQARFRAEQGKLAAVRRRQSEIEAQLAELAKARAGRAALALDDPATRAGADLKWHRWIDTRLTALNIELARLRAEEAAERSRLARIFGQSVATDKLHKRLAHDDARLAAARAERREGG